VLAALAAILVGSHKRRAGAPREARVVDRSARHQVLTRA
jgi:hypothetical protein